MGNLKNISSARPPVYLIVLISIIIGTLCIPDLTSWPFFFPFTGLALAISTLASLLYLSKPNKSIKDTLSFFLTLTFAFFIFYRSNEFLTLLNLGAALFCGSFLILSHNTLIANLKNLIFIPLLALVKPFINRSRGVMASTELVNSNSLTRITNKISKNALGILIAIIAIVVIIPFLAYSNPFFARLVTQFTDLFRIENLFGKMVTFENSLRLFVAGFLILYWPKAISLINDSTSKQSSPAQPSKVFLFIAKVAVSVVLLLFLITQAQLYLATDIQLQQMGYSNSTQTREVFAHLAIVSLIVFTLIYNNPGSGKSKLVTSILILQSLTLILFAAKSDLDYISNFGLTHKRLYGIATLVWTTSAFLLYIRHILSRLNQTKFTQYFAFATVTILIFVNIANFDYLIYHADSPRTGEGKDYVYMARNLSSDSRAYKQILDGLLDKYHREPDNYEVISALKSNLYFKLSDLQQEYKSLNIRTFNFSRYLQYLQIKDINLEMIQISVEYPPPPVPLPGQQNIKPEGFPTQSR